MNICILDNDKLDAVLSARYTHFGQLFMRLFGAVGVQWTYSVYNTPSGEYPADFDAFDAVLLTGSHADAFSDAPWVVELRRRVTQLLAQRKKLIGVCFGHQLIALCLGAPVARAPQGWGTGRMEYTWLGAALPDAAAPDKVALLASHQDQVLALPEGATLLAHNDFCPVAAFAVGSQVLCVQPHPEFLEDISAYLLDKRRALFGEDHYQRSLASLSHGHEGLSMARYMVEFIEGNIPETAAASA